MGVPLLWWSAACFLVPGGDGTDGNDGEPAIPQTESCAAYLTCLEAADSADIELEQQVYGPDGECWTDAQAALACSQICDGGLVAQQALTPLVTECWTDGPPSTELIFGETGIFWEVEPVTGSCSFFADDAIRMEGTEADVFYMTVPYDRSYDEQTACTLAVDGTFTCDSRPYVGTWSGAFRPNWKKMDLHMENDIDCDYVASPQ